MSTEQIWRTASINLDDTLALASAIGAKLRGGEIIELTSDLGGGKTSFVRGLARGAGSKDTVRSPSFTLRNEYRADELTIYHFDFYRLSEPGIMREELAELLADNLAVIVVEWADIIEDVLPLDRLTLELNVKSEHERELSFHYPNHYQYLLPLSTSGVR